MKLARLARTLAPLRPVQIYGRALFRLRQPAPDFAPAPQRRALAGWTAPIARPNALLGPTEARFLNMTGEIARREQWNDPARDKLWLYNLHYFDELAAPASPDREAWRRALVARWIAENPPGAGNGWEPYPVSLRIVNWIKWALSGVAMDSAWLESLAVQARWLMGRLEWHLLGNHLFANAKALVFAGLFFEGREADAWLARGLSILATEMDEQVLADGGHFELSPMYHAIVREDVLDLLNLAAAAGRPAEKPYSGWREAAAQMGAWLSVMTHPDGRIPFFNDAAFGIAPDPGEIEGYAARLGLPPIPAPGEGLTHLAASGYIRLQRGDAVALLDVAPIGPSYLPGHAHADSLSFELSVAGRRVVVNGGTSTYAGPERSYERGTSAHSTVEVAGIDSSEVWGSFRVGRRARIVALEFREEPGELRVAAAHDGYRHLPGRPVHRRTWRLADRSLEIGDEIVGGRHAARARFHLAPGIERELGNAILWDSSAPTRLEPSAWAPAFGVVESISAVTASAAPAPLVTTIGW